MTDIKEIIQSPIFAKQKKKLHENRLKDINNAVKMIFENPDIGDMKKGNLKGIRITDLVTHRLNRNAESPMVQASQQSYNDLLDTTSGNH